MKKYFKNPVALQQLRELGVVDANSGNLAAVSHENSTQNFLGYLYHGTNLPKWCLGFEIAPPRTQCCDKKHIDR